MKSRTTIPSQLIAGTLTLASIIAVGTIDVGAQTAPPPQRLTLGQAIHMAAEQSTSARVSQLRIQEAQSRVTQRRADLLPNFSAGINQGGRSFNTATFGISFPSAPGQPPLFDPNGQIEGPVNILDIRARLQQSLFDPSATARVQSARAAVRSADAEAAEASEQAAAVAAAKYMQLVRATAELDARTSDSTLAAELVTIAQEQLNAGVGVALDVTRAQAQLATTRAGLIAARVARDRARLELTRSLGLPPDAPVDVAQTLESIPLGNDTVDVEKAVQAALSNRADIKADEVRLEAAQIGLKAIQAERKPTIGLVADDGLLGLNPAHLLPTYTWGVQLTVPVFDGRKREARTQEQESVIKELTLRQRDTRMQAVTDVRGAVLDLQGAREQVDAARERLRLAEQELSQARERFRTGVSGNADVVTAALALTSSRTLLIDALTSYHTARVVFARSQGALLSIQ